MEEKVIERIQDLMAKQSPRARREVELIKRTSGRRTGRSVPPAHRILERQGAGT